MSSDNFDLEAPDGRVWANLSMSSYEDLSAASIVVVMELTGQRPTSEYYAGRDYTEYGVIVAQPPVMSDYIQALEYVIRWLSRRVEYLEERVESD